MAPFGPDRASLFEELAAGASVIESASGLRILFVPQCLTTPTVVHANDTGFANGMLGLMPRNTMPGEGGREGGFAFNDDLQPLS